MKRIFALILAVMLVLSMAACGGGSEQKQPEETKAPAAQQTEPQKPQETEAPETTAAPVENWGVVDGFSAYADGKIAGFSISFPTNSGVPKGTGLVASQTDGSFVIVDAHLVDETPDVESLDKVLPTCFTQTELTMRLYRGLTYSDFAFQVTTTESATIKGYEMCKFEGVHTFAIDGVAQTMNFVAYATQLKANGAYVYWMVLDETTDQSLGNTIAEHAYNMALSFAED